MEQMIGLEEAAVLYSEVFGHTVSPKDLKAKRVHHPLGQEFWTKDEITLETFVRSLETTLERQGAASEYNGAKLYKMAQKAAAKSAAITHKIDEDLSPMGW